MPFPIDLPYELGSDGGRLRFESAILRVLPPWLRRTVGAKLMGAFGEVIDDLIDRNALSAKIRFPGEETSALPYIGRDRVISRGPSEPDATYAARLARWWIDHQRRGGAVALLRQLEAYYAASPRRIDLVYQSGGRRWFTPAAIPVTDFGTYGTFTRASPATYWDGTTLTRYASGALRIVPKDGYKGYVLEVSRTNVLERSNDLTQSPWTVSGSVTSRTYGMTGPSGQADATRIVWPAVNGWVFNNITAGEVPDSTDFVLSFWARSISGTASVRAVINRRNGTFGIYDLAITTSWARYTVTESFVSGGSTAAVTFNNNATARTIDIFGCQVEVGGYVTSLIETTGAGVTRAADVLTQTIEGVDLDVPWVGLFEPAATLAQRASGSTTLLWRESAGDDTDIRLASGSSGVAASLFREALGGTPSIAGFDYAAGDRLKFYVDGPGGLFRIEGSTPDGAVEDAGTGFSFDESASYVALETTGANGQSGWVSDIYPAMGSAGILASIEGGAVAGEIVRDSIAWSGSGDPAQWAQAWLFHHVGEDPGTLTAEEEEQYRAIPRDWNAAHVLPIHVWLIWGEARLWEYPQPLPTWDQQAASATWSEIESAIYMQAE